MIIPRRCHVCKKMIWWWDKIEYMEMTCDYGYPCHEECFTLERWEKEMDKWFKDIGLYEALQNSTNLTK